MELVGHRGCADHNPENTVWAVSAAAERLPAVEVDVRRCASGEVVAFHDERVDETTEGSGRIADLDLETLRSLHVAGSDERIATFAEILDAVPGEVTIHVELKEPGLHADVRAALADHGRSNVRLSSFSAPALAELHQSDWRPDAGLLFGERPDPNLALAKSLDCENVHPHVDQCLETDVVDRAHDEGFAVFAWGLTDVSAVPELEARGVDGVTTDTWDVPTPG